MKTLPLVAVLAISIPVSAQDTRPFMTSEQILRNVIRHYDPDARWGQFRGAMHLSTVFPQGNCSEEDLVLDQTRDLYQSVRFAENQTITRRTEAGDATVSLNGRTDLTAAEREEHQLNDEKLGWLREHHLLHFGLPMRLQELGIAPDETWTRQSFRGKECIVLTFSPPAGEVPHPYYADPLVLYIDAGDYAIRGVGYTNQQRPFPSCYALFSEEIVISGIHIPRVKTYYRADDDSYFFTDLFSPLTRQNYQGREAEEAAIRQVLEDETLSFYVRDYNQWTTYWSHQPDVFFSSVSQNGYTIRKGWDEVSTHIRTYMRENPDPHQPPIERSNYVYHLQGDLAWVYFDNREGEQWGRHQRVLRKENGRWKLINMTGINESSYAENDR